MQIGIDVVDDVLLVQGDRQDLSFTIDANDPIGGFVRRSDEDGLGTDSVHVDANPRFNIVQVDVTVLGDQVNDAVLGTHLKRRRSVIITVVTAIITGDESCTKASNCKACS